MKVGRELISKVTDAVMDDARAWAQRPLEDVCPVIFLDAMVLKIREGGSAHRRPREAPAAGCDPCFGNSFGWALPKAGVRAGQLSWVCTEAGAMSAADVDGDDRIHATGQARSRGRAGSEPRRGRAGDSKPASRS